MGFSVTFDATAGNGDAARANQYLTAFAVFASVADAEAVADAARGIAAGIEVDDSTPHGPVIVARDATRVIITVRNRRTARATASGVAWGTLGNAMAAAIPSDQLTDAVAHDGTDTDAVIAAEVEDGD